MRFPTAVEEQVVRHKQAILQNVLAGVGRVDLLAERIAMHIESLVPQGRARCLEIGADDPTLAEAVRDRVPRIDYRCIAVEDFAAEAGRKEGRALPFAEREFDIALICDVLQRTPHNAQVLDEAGRVAKRVLVKDHFEHGSYSRTMLRLMDYVGHWRHGGKSVPHHHFTRDSFTRLATEQRFVITALDCGPALNQDGPVARTLRPDSDFIAVLRRVA